MINREYWEEACSLFSMTEEEQNLAERLLEGPLEISAAFGRDMDRNVFNEGRLLAPVFGHTQKEVFLYPVFVSYIKGELPDHTNGSLPDGLSLLFPEQEKVYGADGLLEEFSLFFGDSYVRNTEHGRCAVLSGKDGHLPVARQTAFETARPLLVWDGSAVDETEVLLTAVLYQTILCLDDRQGKVSDEGYDFAGKLVKCGHDLLVLTKELKNTKKLSEQIHCLVREISMPEEADRQKFLKFWMDTHSYDENAFLNPKAAERLIRESFTISELNRILGEAEQEFLLWKAKNEGNYLPEESFISVFSRYDDENADMGSIKKLTANRTLKDLCLPAEHHKRLSMICEMLKKRDTVLSDWGFSEKYSYGNGISILFYGAPGTGKTMAAQVIAAELNLPLYRVDLSGVISKYIGETQKNIAKIFEQTKKVKGILLFDEADALFSRRNEVNDAQDKYANAETAYLLQRIEESDGICILTTNLLQNFDEAFRRRITYMINFPMPDAALRRQLWDRVFPETTPLSEELDLELLADSFELSGAAIRNAAMQSAWMAAAGTGCVTMQDVLSGIANEYRKINRALKPDQKALMELYDAVMF